MGSTCDVLIWTIPGDMHAAAVWWALRQKGISALPLRAATFPSRATISFAIDDGLTIRVGGEAIACDPTAVPVHWLRRSGKPMVKDLVAPADQDMALKEWQSALNSLRLITESAGLFCVNPPHTYSTYAEKPYHLHVAKQAGLNVPKTLISSSCDDVKDFLDNVKRVLFKAMKPSVWKNKYGRVHEIYTSEVDKSIFQYNSNISLCPGIYQEFIEKVYDVRILVMGRSVFGLYIRSDGGHDIDVRYNISHRFDKNIELRTFSSQIPDDIVDKIISFMKNLGIIFCTFDFAVDVNGSWYFLEANEMGQFLWMETICPEIPAIDAFSEFLISMDQDFIYRANKSIKNINMKLIIESDFQKEYINFARDIEDIEELYVYE